MSKNRYDIIVVGAGHAGIEAAWAAANLDVSVLMLTISPDTIGKLSCNPAVGGVCKGHLVREVDAMGGLIGKITDIAAVSYRRLNKSKGKAVWSTRVQVDKDIYPKVAREFLEGNENIEILQAECSKLLVKDDKVYGVETNFGQKIFSKSVIICAGTFLGGLIHIGLNNFSGGRLYEKASNDLFKSINKLKIKTKKFKTGTCARLDKRTIDYSKMIEQYPEYDVEPFSMSTKATVKNQLSCFITHTNKKTHKIILDNLDRSPLYSGKIKATGVRYCPSLEDKLVKFSDRDAHQVFIEPEGFESCEIYPNGISTSLPFDVQEKFIHTINGLEKAKIIRPGYGIEHGLIDCRQLDSTLEVKNIKNLFFAGQVNGTTGYEEAAAQGLIAGINAGLKAKRKKPFILSRSDGFIGVLIDDLITKGTNEPYRMFTSRSEYRLSLRESNADLRLSNKAYEIGLLDDKSYGKVLKKKKDIERTIKFLKNKKIDYRGKKITCFDLLKRPDKDFSDLEKIVNYNISDVVKREVEIVSRYETFLKREEQSLKLFSSFHKVKIPAKIDYKRISSLSSEISQKLSKFKPKTVKDALSISGVTPAAALIIYSYIDKKKYLDK